MYLYAAGGCVLDFLVGTVVGLLKAVLQLPGAVKLDQECACRGHHLDPSSPYRHWGEG